MSKSISTVKLRKAVCAAARAAFSETRQAHAKEKFYVFGLMTNDSAQYLYPMANSEQALARTVKKYKKDGYKDQSADELRWSFGDWEYAEEGESHFEAVNEMLSEATEFDDVDEDEVERTIARLMKAVVAGLDDLNKEGFFGAGSDRLEVAVMIVGDLDGGQTREWIEQLNPPEVAAQFADTAQSTGTFHEVGSGKVSGCKALAVTADGKFVGAGGDFQIFGWSLPDFAEKLKKRVGAYKTSHWGIHTMAVSRDGSELAIGWKSLFNADGGIERWSIPKQKRLDAPPVLQGGVWCLAYAPDSRSLASAGEDGKIRVWDLSNCEVIREMTGHRGYVESVEFSPDGKYLISLDREPKSLRVWEAATGKLAHRLDGQGVALAFTPDGTQVAVAAGTDEKSKPEISFWNIRTGKRTRTLSVGIKAGAIAMSSDGGRMVIGGALPGRAELWDLKAEKCLEVLDPNYVSIDDMVFVNQDRAVALVGWANQRRPPLLVWELRPT